MNRMLKTVLAIMLLSGASNAQEASTKSLRVGSDITSPPYIFFDNSKKPAGFDAEFMEALAKAGNFKLEFLDTRFENLILGLSANKFDVIASSMFIKPERAKQIDFIPYANAGLGIASVAAAEFQPETVDKLCGKRVGLIKGAAYRDTIQKICAEKGEGVDIREYPTSAEATQALLSGNVDAQADDAAVLKVAVDKTNGRVKISSKEVLFPVVLGLGVSKQHPEIKGTLEQAFETIKSNGVYKALLARYNLSAPSEAQFKAATGEK
ncbi:ABC transporter substrate-binding protein [Microvirga sp. VF16]|uniref:ABC transporter substrate-binding protein n=1 Tax=Microvirga sp. VF16 TaxID=2807101 RepID=UPI00193CA2A9|nr:ABC transporter substrate-binding protein [Microvirga sp. VF16]QRM33146.1 amino acid ABC transporter substrate-binding protein [Microvirga sp. VF16]